MGAHEDRRSERDAGNRKNNNRFFHPGGNEAKGAGCFEGDMSLPGRPMLPSVDMLLGGNTILSQSPKVSGAIVGDGANARDSDLG
jgi:hypothetical protein